MSGLRHFAVYDCAGLFLYPNLSGSFALQLPICTGTFFLILRIFPCNHLLELEMMLILYDYRSFCKMKGTEDDVCLQIIRLVRSAEGRQYK